MRELRPTGKISKKKSLLVAFIALIISSIVRWNLISILPPPFAGTLLYISEDHYDPSWYGNCIYRIIEQDVQSGAQTIHYESSEPIHLIRDRAGNPLAAQCGEGNLTRIWDARTSSTVWEGQLREEFDPQFDGLLMLNGDTLYYRLNLTSEGVTWVTVCRQKMNAQPEILMQFEGDPRAEHYALSNEGDLAYVRLMGTGGEKNRRRAHVCLRHEGEEIVVGEGSFPFFGGSSELCYIQGAYLMRYDLNTRENAVARYSGYHKIWLPDFEGNLFTSPSLAKGAEYLVYAKNMDTSQSMSNPAAIEVLSLTKSSVELFKDVTGVSKTEPVFAFLK